jgi:hypothetical protein
VATNNGVLARRLAVELGKLQKTVDWLSRVA